MFFQLSPALAGAGATLARLGEALFFDASLSEPPGTSCASCHDPKRAFSADNDSGLGVPRGSKPTSIGFRKAPTVMYAQFAPAPEPVKSRTPSRPKERLRGGGDPEEEPEENDPRRLADLIRKSR